MYAPNGGGGVPLSQNPYARRQLGLSPQIDPQTMAMLVKMGVHVAGMPQSGGMVQRSRTARLAGPPQRTAQRGLDLSAMGGGLTAIPEHTAEGPVAPPGMPPAAPQPAGGPTFGQGMDEMQGQAADQLARMQQMMQQGQPMQRAGQLGRQNAIAAQLVKRLMLHRMIGRLAQPAAGPAMPGPGPSMPVGGHPAY